MPEQSPEVIERFILWLYTGQLSRGNEEPKDLNREQFADLYIAGDIYGIPELQNSVMDCFVAWAKTSKCRKLLSILHHVYENTPKDCSLQRFLVERAATKFDFSRPWFEIYQALYPQQFLMGLVQELFRHKKGNPDSIDWNNPGCRYHVHHGDVVKPAEGHSDTSCEQGEEKL